MAIIQDLTIFGDDDVTPLLGSMNMDGTVNVATCSTDPAHVRPYMKQIDSNIVNTTIDFKNGTSTMGGCNVSVVDAPITVGDQTTGWFTHLLASATTHDTAILMRRAILRQQDTAGVMRPVFDGIVLDPSLDANMVTYNLSLRDVSERGRKTPVFQHTIGTSIVPRGITAGYGTIYGTLSSFPATQVIKPAGWEYGIFRLDPNSPRNGVYSGRVDLHEPRRYSTQWWSDWTTKNAATLATFGAPLPVFDPNTAGYVATRFANIVVQWRVTGSGTAFKTVSDMPQGVGMQYDTSTALLVTSRGLPVKKGQALSYITISSLASSDLPTNGANVDVRVLSNMPPSTIAPMYIETPFWQLLMDIYDGVYAFDPSVAPKIRYDHARLATLLAQSAIARATIVEPAADLYTWVAENIYKPLGYAPGINEQGEVYPVSLALPDVTVPLLTLNDSNMIPAGTAWTHTKDDAITSTEFVYQRDYVAPPNPASTSWSDWLYGIGFDMSNDFERLLSQEIQIRRVNSSTVLFGDKPMQYQPVTVHSVTTDTTGLSLTGNAGDELGVQLANQQELAIKDRFSQGAQRLTAQCRATDAGVRAAKLGDWCIVGASWLPDYNTQKRGMNRLMQIIQIQTPSGTSRTFTLSDAGPSLSPLAQPVIGNLRVSYGQVLVDVTSVPSGGTAEVQYAVADTEPDTTSAMWLVVGRTSVAATLSTPSVPVGSTVWMRSIGKGAGKISSAPTSSISIAIAVLPAITAVNTSIDPATTQVQINWTPLTNARGLRIAYAVTTDPELNPTLSSSVDVDATLNTTVLSPSVPEGEYLVFTLTPYSVFTGGTASGTAGVVAGRYVQGNLPDSTTGTSTIGPNLVVTPEPGTGAYSIAWSGDSVQLSIDAAAYGTPSTSPIVVTLDAGSHTYSFTGTKNGQTVTDSVTVPALAVSGVNTVTPDLNVVQGTSTATATPFTATASNPSGGAAPTIKVTVAGTTASGSTVGAITPGTATTIPSGEVVTVARPTSGSLPASVSFVADLGTGNGKEQIGWPILNQDLPYSQIDIQITSSTATTQTVSVTATAPNGTPMVKFVGVTGSAVKLSGPAAGVASASGTVWVFTRGAALGGDGQAQFEANVAGAVSDDDFTTIPAQGRDTTYLVSRARVTASSATAITVRYAVADPYPQGAGSGTINYQALGVGTVAPATGGTVTPAATLTEAAGTYIDYTIARPLFGTGTGRVTFTATAAGRISDSDAVDVPAQDAVASAVASIRSNQTDRTVSAVTLTMGAANLPAVYTWGVYKTVPQQGNYFINVSGSVSGLTPIANGTNASNPLSGSPTVGVTANVASIDNYALLITTAALPGGAWVADNSVTVMPRLVAIGATGDVPAYLPLAGGALSGSVTGPQFTGTVATGTPPLVVASTTLVANLNANYLNGHADSYFATTSGLSSYLTISAAAAAYAPKASPTFTGMVTAPQFTSTVASGSGSPFYVDSTDMVINLNANLLGGHPASYFLTGTSGFLPTANPTFTGLMSGPSYTGIRYTSTQTTGTAPFTVASTTMVSNLNVQYLNGNINTDFALLSGAAFSGAISATTGGFTGRVSSSAAMNASGQVRATGWWVSGDSTGPAAEMGYSGGGAAFLGYNRGTSSYVPVAIAGTTISLQTSTGAAQVNATGYFTVGAYAGSALTAGDICARRDATHGVYYFGDSAAYLYYDGTLINASTSVHVNGYISIAGQMNASNALFDSASALPAIPSGYLGFGYSGSTHQIAIGTDNTGYMLSIGKQVSGTYAAYLTFTDSTLLATFSGGATFSGSLQQAKGTGTMFDVPTMTLSTSAAPGSSTGYPTGHVWIQVDAPL